MAAGGSGAAGGPKKSNLYVDSKIGVDDDESTRSISPPKESPLSKEPRSLRGRVSVGAPVADEDHIILANKRYAFPILADDFFAYGHRWGLDDFFRMTPPVPSVESGSNFDLRLQLQHWAEASLNDVDEEITPDIENRIIEFFHEPVSEKDERDHALKYFAALRPEGVTEKQFQAVGAKIIAEKVDYISFDDFKNALQTSVRSYILFLKDLKKSPHCTNFYFIIPKDPDLKSNLWVARLAYQQFKDEGVAPDGFMTVEEFEEKQKEDPHIRGVTFDDCSYTGTQLAGRLCASSGIDVIVPFCTFQAKAAIASETGEDSFFAPFTPIPTLREFGLRKLDLICSAGAPFFAPDIDEKAIDISSRTLTFFEHKSADDLSVVAGLRYGLKFPFHEIDTPKGYDKERFNKELTECYKQVVGTGHQEL